ncbi:MAG: hypothetical protein WDN48_20615 [Pseudolabrys sp.]
MKNTKSIAGLIVTNDNGQIAYSAGAGNSPLILSLVKDESWRTDAVKRRLMPIATSEHKWLVIWIRVTELHVGVIVDDVTDTVFEFTAAVDFAWDIINHLLSDPFNAMTVVDSDARVAFLSPVHEGFFASIAARLSGGRWPTSSRTPRLDRVAKTGKAEIATCSACVARTVSSIACPSSGMAKSSAPSAA